jgi:hypothetical protein
LQFVVIDSWRVVNDWISCWRQVAADLIALPFTLPEDLPPRHALLIGELTHVVGFESLKEESELLHDGKFAPREDRFVECLFRRQVSTLARLVVTDQPLHGRCSFGS